MDELKLRKILAVVVGMSVAALPIRGWPEPAPVYDQLPRLGDAAGATLSARTERQIGERIRSDLRREGEIDADVEVSQYLNLLGARLSKAAATQGNRFEFFLVRERSLNAFALPGGIIGVHAGLIVAAESESELASVLAHEMGHVVQRHIARMLEKQDQTSIVALVAMVLAMIAAGSSGDAAAGLAALGESVHVDQMLRFSRDAEREADRVGLDVLSQGGFNTGDMVVFFGRLQNATSVYESGAPIYLRTHPLTSERMADIQNRLRSERYRQFADSIDFHLVRAKLGALAQTDPDGLRKSRARIERRIRERSFVNEAAAWYGLAVVADAQHDDKTVAQALSKAEKFLGKSHPYFERLRVEALDREARTNDALARSAAALERFPDARALVHQRLRLLVRAGRHRDAIALAEQQLSRQPEDAQVWRSLADARFGLGQMGKGRLASAERYALEGGLLAAIEQLRIAQREQESDFITASRIDARLRELQQRYKLEHDEREKR
ncbi:MAG: M48 family metallopeptidase [Burkholderiaceae bacterium]|nr:M48 family metallopeptidase [Burkholderiaceae bacterium]